MKMSRKYKIKSFQLCRCCFKWRCQCLLPRKRKPHPPFNSGTKLDSKIGLHPKLKALIPISPAVGSYDPRPIDRKSVISWRKQQETEEFSATMGGRLTKEIMKQRNLMISERGPGSHEIFRWPENTMNGPCKSGQTNVSFGNMPRFYTRYKSTTPGPGYTLRTHNPFFYMDQKRLKGFSHIPSFEFDNLVPRFRETVRPWSLPCTRYNVKHPKSLQVFLEKVVSKRGPYDLFTGLRDETSIKGYWAHAKLEDQNDWPRKLSSEMEKLWNKCNYFKGKWSTNPRFLKKPVMRIMLQNINACYKNPDEPGPGYYNPQTFQKPTSFKKYPFDSNAECERSFISNDNPGPGRYNVKRYYHIKGHGWTCIFKSKVSRTIGVVAPSLYND